MNFSYVATLDLLIYLSNLNNYQWRHNHIQNNQLRQEYWTANFSKLPCYTLSFPPTTASFPNTGAVQLSAL